MVNFFQKLGLGLKKTSAKLTGGISDIFTKQKVDSQTLNDLQDVLIAADMGVKASAKIIETFGKRRLNKDISEAEIRSELAADIEQILTPCEKGFVIDNHKKPCIILMIGVNGAGKTTTIGKLAAKLKNAQSGHKPQISFIAGDTFRAAAVEQLSVWGERNGIRVFKGSDGCDAAGLCYDGIQEALRQNDDIVFIDTAGRLQNKTGLMDELKKITRVIQKIIPEAPHQTLLTIDATTGQNALDQVKTFREICPVDGLVVTKLDGSAKGGILVAITEESPLPVYFIGVGEGIDDLDSFSARDYAQNLLSL